jgi:hypothetical protein
MFSGFFEFPIAFMASLLLPDHPGNMTKPSTHCLDTSLSFLSFLSFMLSSRLQAPPRSTGATPQPARRQLTGWPDMEVLSPQVHSPQKMFPFL